MFLYRLTRGAASRSYGVAVAKLAALPEPVLLRAKSVLAQLESQGTDILNHLPTEGHQGAATRQLDLFHSPSSIDKTSQQIVDSLRSIDTERLTPLEALALLDRWKKSLE